MHTVSLLSVIMVVIKFISDFAFAKFSCRKNGRFCLFAKVHSAKFSCFTVCVVVSKG